MRNWRTCSIASEKKEKGVEDITVIQEVPRTEGCKLLGFTGVSAQSTEE